MQKYRSQLLLAPVLLLALYLRVWGINWGLPNQLHFFSYHPDETVIIMHATQMLNTGGLNIFAGIFLPHFYNYGSLQLMLVNIVTMITWVYAPHGANVYGSQQLYYAYYYGRLLTVLMGTATVGVLWAFGRRVFSEWVGLAGALLLAIAPLHAQHSHFLTVDVPATLWVTLTLLWSARLLTEDNPWPAVLIAATFAGLAAATKYNCALALFPVAAAILCRPQPDEKRAFLLRIGFLVAAGAAAIAAFVIGCPGSVLDTGQFVNDFLFEARHVSTQQELWFVGSGNGWWYVLTRNLDAGLSLPLLAAAVLGVVLAARKRTPGDWICLSFALPYYLLVGAAVSRYARYEIPLIPVLCLLAARLLLDNGAAVKKSITLSLQFAFAVVVVVAGLSTYLLELPMSQDDPRDRAAVWINSHTPSNSPVGFAVEPWFWSPPLNPYFSLPGVGQWVGVHGAHLDNSRLRYTSDQPFEGSYLLETMPQTVVISEYEYFDRLRTHDRATADYLTLLKQSYQPAIVFSDQHPLGGRKEIDGLPCQDLPHDMLYPSPAILVFERR